MDGKHLIEKALSARRYAYAPYSNFFVGAALLCRNGKIYTGCNVETSTFTPTSCAERTAFVKALSEGEREFVAIAVVGGRGEEKDTGFWSALRSVPTIYGGILRGRFQNFPFRRKRNPSIFFGRIASVFFR